MPIILAGQSNSNVEVEANSRAMRVNQRTRFIDGLGSYKASWLSAQINAGAAAGFVFQSFRWADASRVAVIRSVRVGLQSMATGFTKGSALIELVVARSYTASETAGTILTPSGDNTKLRSAPMGTTLVAGIRQATGATAVSGGTRTLDGLALASVSCDVPATTNFVCLSNRTPLFEPGPNEWPLVLTQDTGFLIEYTVPATGTWKGTVQLAWDEMDAYP